MFLLLESKKEIAAAQRALELTIHRSFKKTITRNIGYPGGTTLNAPVHSDGKYWFYSSDYRASRNYRNLNWFGLLRDGGALQISVEINTPYEGRNAQIAGFFARDHASDSIYLFHSGRVGGGRHGVGKFAFLASIDQPLAEIVDASGRAFRGVMVMPISGKAAIRSAIRYIDTIARFKEDVRSGITQTPDFKQKRKIFEDFYSEGHGRRKGNRRTEIDYLSRHGEIVDALRLWRNKKVLPPSSRIVKNVLIDLGVAVGSELVEVYEVKTSAERSNIYTAIGQIMVHGTAESCQRAIVLPKSESVQRDLGDALKRLDIEIVRFELSDTECVILS
ncbi:MAG: hypothetical protein WCA81_16325 [Rhizomicrobium sp.]